MTESKEKAKNEIDNKKNCNNGIEKEDKNIIKENKKENKNQKKIAKIEKKNIKKENSIKVKKHHNPGRGIIRVIALLLALIMIMASAATLIFYLTLG